MQIRNFLRNISLFNNLTSKEYGYIEANVEQKICVKGTLVFKKGDKSENLYLVEKGTIKLYNKRAGTEKEEIVCIISKGGYFCLAPLLSLQKLHINAETIERSFLYVIPKNVIGYLIESSHIFAQNIIRALACKECELCDQICTLSLATTKERLAKFLLSEYRIKSDTRSLKITLNQSQIASCLGTTRETVSRDLADLKKAKIIHASRNIIEILNPDELSHLALGNAAQRSL